MNAILWGGFFIGAAILLEGLAANPWIVGAGFLVGGFFNSIHNMGIRDMVYIQVPEHRQGQCWALIGSLFSSMVLVGDLLGTPGMTGGCAHYCHDRRRDGNRCGGGEPAAVCAGA